MASGLRSALLINSAAALGGVVVMGVLVFGVLQDAPTVALSKGSSSARGSAAGGHVDAGEPTVADRLAFVPRGTIAVEPPANTDRTSTAEPPALRESAAWAPEVSQPSRSALQSSWSFTLRTEPRASVPTAKVEVPRRNTYSLKARLSELSPAATVRLAMRFEAAKVPWPPAEIALVAIKDEKALELHARSAGGAWMHVHRYRVLAASGGAGPKLIQGDKQVPEGIYGISYLNPNSAYHVALRVNYPNAFDRQMAAKDGRKNLGGDIMIHGKNLSAGCLAMGDDAVEELFVLAAQTGLPKIKLIIAPTDFRKAGPQAATAAAITPTPASLSAKAAGLDTGRPDWLPKLYGEIAVAMADFKAPPPPPSKGLLSLFMK